MILCVNGPASLGGERCNPVTVCPEPGVWLNVRGFRSLFIYKTYVYYTVGIYNFTEDFEFLI
jgi:hypothetical protein